MSLGRVRFEYRHAATAEIGVLVDTGVARTAGSVRDDAKRIIRAEGRVDTGALVQSIETRRVGSAGHTVTYEVGSRLDYAIYQHEGVRGPVLPRTAKVLRFKPSGSSKFVFARQTKGFRGIYFLTRALRDVRV